MATKSLTFDIFGRDRTASKAIRGVGNEADRTSGRFKNLAVAGGIALVAVAGAAIKFGTDSVKAYAESEEAQLGLQDVMDRFPRLADTNIEKLRELNTELMNKTRFDDDAIAAGQAVLGQFKLTGAELETLTPLMLDYAQKTGKDVPTAATDLGKAILGNGKALKAVGINFQDTGSEAGNAAALVDALRGQVGGFAEESAGTAAGKLDVINNKFGEMQEAVGEKLIDPLSDAMDELSDSGAIEDMGTALAGVVTGFTDLEKKTGFLSDFASDMGDVQSMIDDLTAAGDALSSGDFGKMSDWVGEEFGQGGLMGTIFGGEWMKNPPLPPLPDSMRQMFEDTTAEAEAGSENTRRGMGGGFNRAAIDTQFFRDAQTQGFAGMWGSIDGGTATGLSGVNSTTGTGLGTIGTTLGGMSPRARGAFTSAWLAAQNATGTGWSGVHGSTRSGMGTTGSILGGFRSIVQGPFGGVGSWLVSSGESLVQGFISGIRGMIGGVGSAVGDVLAFAKGFFPNSPAERGPFSGEGWRQIERSGYAIGDTFAEGLYASTSNIGIGADGILSQEGLLAVDGSPRFSGGDGSGVTVYVTNKSGAALSDLISIEVERAGRRQAVSLGNGSRRR